jgi:hypothetical protein
MRLRTLVATLLLDLREEFTQELADFRYIVQPRIGKKVGRLSGQRLREAVSGLGWLLPRSQALWTVLLLNWALFLLVVVFWVAHRLGRSGYLLIGGTGVTLFILYAYFYDLAWGKQVLLERPPRPPFMPVHKRKWLGRAVRLRYRLDLLWMAIRNEFTGEIVVLGPYCPRCRPRQKLLARARRKLLGLTWFGRLAFYEWHCPRCGQRYPRPPLDEEEIAERIRGELKEEEW